MYVIHHSYIFRRIQYCLFSIYISQYEGWGLPIGESLWFGKPVISVNNSSLPEVGGDLVDQADGSTMKSLEDACHRLCFDEAHYKFQKDRIVKAKLRSAGDFALSLSKVLLST